MFVCNDVHSFYMEIKKKTFKTTSNWFYIKRNRKQKKKV